METLHRDTKWHVARICALWGAIAGSYNILQICIPLITRDIDPDHAPQWLGVFMSTNAICGAVFSVIGGFFSDSIGRMALMRPWTAYFFVSVGVVLIADRVKSVYLLILARTASLALPTTFLLAYLSDFLRGAALVESYGYLSGSFGICNFIFTILCGAINRLHSRTASLYLAIGSAGLALFLVLFSPPPRHVQEAIENQAEEALLRGKSNKITREELKRSLRIIVMDRYLLLLCIACSAVRMANMNDHLMIVYFINFRTDADLTTVSYILGSMALTMSLSQLFLLPLAVRRRCVFPIIVASLLGMTLCVMGFALCFKVSQFFAVAVLLGCSLVAPSVFNARISALTSSAGTSGITLGLISTFANGVEIAAAVLYGNLLKWSTHTFSNESFWSGVPLLINGASIALALLLLLYAELRYGSKFGPWGAEQRRLEGSVDPLLSECSPLCPTSGLQPLRLAARGAVNSDEGGSAMRSPNQSFPSSPVAPGLERREIRR